MSQVKDPVCGRLIDPRTATGRVTHESQVVYFCSEQCRRRFEAAPENYPLERHEPPYTVNKGMAAPKFGSAASGGLELEGAPEQHKDRS
jgi:YHS domain-containing protein